MKKVFAIAMALILMTACAALAEAPDPDFFSGTWVCDRASIEMDWEEEGYRVLIQWSSSAWECTEWEYSGYYYEESNTVVTLPFGSRTEIVYDDSGEVVSLTEVYNDGEATFSFDEEGYLIWQDDKENAGEGMRFEKAPEQITVGDLDDLLEIVTEALNEAAEKGETDVEAIIQGLVEKLPEWEEEIRTAVATILLKASFED